VTLPKVFVADLTSEGATAGATQFAIGLTCPLGIAVNVTLTDASNGSNRTNIAKLAPGSSAEGLGLQILNGSGPVAYGPDSSIIGNANQWLAGKSSNGQMSVPLTARYIRTSGPLVPGSVKGAITFTMSYQ
jgi:type 1 fimbria pilin